MKEQAREQINREPYELSEVVDLIYELINN